MRGVRGLRLLVRLFLLVVLGCRAMSIRLFSGLSFVVHNIVYVTCVYINLVYMCSESGIVIYCLTLVLYGMGFEKFDCEPVGSVSEVDSLSGEKYFFQENNNVRLETGTARNAVDSAIDRGEKSPVVACGIRSEDTPVKPHYYHVTPENNTGSIEKDGLLPSHAPDCPNGEGVYVTEDRSSAVSWAATLSAERSVSKWRVAEVSTPSTQVLVEDKQPINGGAVPNSSVVCTDVGVPRSEIVFEDRIEEFNPNEEKTGGFL